MKKVLAILLAALLMTGIASIGAAADTEAVTVALSGSSQAIKSEQYEVTLSAPVTVGGISGEIDYDESKFEFKSINITSDFAAVNKISEGEETNLIIDDGNVIKFALLPDTAGTSETWVTFNFTVVETGTAGFTLQNVNVSDPAGVNLITEGLSSVSITETPVYEKALDVMGSSVRTSGAADIRFEVSLENMAESYKGQIAEVGVIMIPTAFVEAGQELTVDATYSGKKSAIAKMSGDKLGDETQIYANLLNSTNSVSRIKTAISARAYIKLNDNTVIYSDNINGDININGGTSSRSCIDAIKGVAAANGYVDDDEKTIETILVKENSAWTLEDYSAVVAALNSKILG